LTETRHDENVRRRRSTRSRSRAGTACDGVRAGDVARAGEAIERNRAAAVAWEAIMLTDPPTAQPCVIEAERDSPRGPIVSSSDSPRYRHETDAQPARRGVT
jgi:hypothetical protein